MTKDELAQALDGIDYPTRISKELLATAKTVGLVVVYGASDDLVEFRGAIHDEAGHSEGSGVLVDRKGVLESWDQLDKEDEADVRAYLRRKDSCSEIRSFWFKQDAYAWTFETDIPHASFDVMDDGERWCRAIVFSMHDMPLPEKRGG